MRATRGLAVLLATMGFVSGCARPQPPRGGPIPDTPLSVVETVPVNLSVVESFDDPVVIRFPRTLSERLARGSLQSSVLVSPETGDIRVRLSGDAVEISMEGGFAAGEIYRVDVQPNFQDRYQNALPSAYELFFSTGPEFEPNLLAGVISDRLTLDLVDDVRVDAVLPGSRVVQATVSDSSGVFSFPYLPAGSYTLVAYDDTNRDGQVGFTERQDSLAVTLSLGDTLVVTDLSLLAPDTTAAVLQEATVLDSISVSARLDDYLDPDVPLVGVQATVSAEGNEPIPVAEYLHRNEWDERQPAPTPVVVTPPDSVAAAGAQPPAGAPPPGGAVPPGGPGAVPPDAAVPPPPGAPGPAAQAQAPATQTRGPPLPSQEVIIVLTRPLIAGLTYDIELDGVVNINGVPDGGGSAQAEAPLPPGL